MGSGSFPPNVIENNFFWNPSGTKKLVFTMSVMIFFYLIPPPPLVPVSLLKRNIQSSTTRGEREAINSYHPSKPTLVLKIPYLTKIIMNKKQTRVYRWYLSTFYRYRCTCTCEILIKVFFQFADDE